MTTEGNYLKMNNTLSSERPSILNVITWWDDTRSRDTGDDSRWGIESKCINNPDWYEYDVSHDNLMVQISPSGNHLIKCSIVPVIAASPEGEAPRWYLKWPLWLCTGCLYSLSLIKSLRSLLYCYRYPLHSNLINLIKSNQEDKVWHTAGLPDFE